MADDRSHQVPRRALGASELEVSVMALGSWRTYERIPREQGLEVMHAAREAGITLLDDARYDDETGTAPIPTGYSEVVFGELFRATGWDRDEVMVSNKLWWEFWPEQSAQAELDASLGRMGLDHVDLIYAIHPPPELSMEVLVEEVAGVIDSGRARAWGTGMWSAAQHHAAIDVCDRTGAPRSCAAQMATSLVDHAGPADPEMQRAFERGPIGLVASYVLAGGALIGRYERGEPGPVNARGMSLATAVAALAAEWGVPPAHVAFAYAFQQPSLATVLFGASTAAQLTENVAAWSTFEQLDESQLAEVRALAEMREIDDA
jgi:aryl-alcohol dehydrogenase-like predicted oxidoreductase